MTNKFVSYQFFLPTSNINGVYKLPESNNYNLNSYRGTYKVIDGKLVFLYWNNKL